LPIIFGLAALATLVAGAMRDSAATPSPGTSA
jgi:hypothetical protein